MDYHTYSQYTDNYINTSNNQQYIPQPQPPPYNYATPPQFDYQQNFHPTYPPNIVQYNSADPRLKTHKPPTFPNPEYHPHPQPPQSYEFPNYFTEENKLDLKITKMESIQVKSDDELWVETFLANIGKIKINLESTIEVKQRDTKKIQKPKPTININATKSTLRKCLVLLDQLKKSQKYLAENVNVISTVEWKKKTIEIGNLKEELVALQSHFDHNNLKMLQQLLEKRKKKRNRQKQQKVMQKQMEIEKEHMRALEEKKIDDWLENMKDEIERCKMEENMKKDADCVLAEVTKKKSDARKHIALLTSLIKLRAVREIAASQKAEKTSAEDRSIFANITEKLMNMWQNALKSYNKEEQGLRMMLEQNVADDTKQNRIAKEKKITQEWELIFFGQKTIPSPAYWGLTSAERNVETFIAIRKSWDTFLAKQQESGSTIPVGWILPSDNASDQWLKYLSTN